MLPLSVFFLQFLVAYFVIGIEQHVGGPALPGDVSLTWQDAWVMFAQPLLGLAVLIAGIALYRYGTRLLQVSTWRFLTDRRPPVLFLRSFAFDPAADMTDIVPIFFPQRRFEESLVRVLQPLGPVLAIGRPHEKLPETGADRIYVAEADWRAAVSYFTERAAAVFILAGDSAGLRWEMKHVLREMPLDRLLFGFPYIKHTSSVDVGWFTRVKQSLTRGWDRFHPREQERQHRYQAFVQCAASCHQHNLPGSLGEAQYLIFDAEGRARLLATQRSVLQQLVLWAALPYRLLPASLQPFMSYGLIDHAVTLTPFISAAMMRSTTPPASGSP